MRSLNKRNLVIVGLFVLLLACVGWQATVVQQSNPVQYAAGQIIGFGNDTFICRGGVSQFNLSNSGTSCNQSGSVSGATLIATDAVANNSVLVALGVKAGSAGLLGFTSGAVATAGSLDTAFSKDAAGVIDVGNGSAGDKTGTLQYKTMVITATAFASLGTPGNGTMVYCNDCTIANPCAGAGSGALAKRLNGVWVCN